jgi:hypothetical protein
MLADGQLELSALHTLFDDVDLAATGSDAQAEPFKVGVSDSDVAAFGRHGGVDDAFGEPNGLCLRHGSTRITCRSASQKQRRKFPFSPSF